MPNLTDIKLNLSSIKAEQYLLGTVIQQSIVNPLIAKWLVLDLFFYEKHKAIAEAIRYTVMLTGNTNLSNISERLEEQSRLQFVGGASYLKALETMKTEFSQADKHFITLRQLSSLRKLCDSAINFIDAEVSHGYVDRELTQKEIFYHTKRIFEEPNSTEGDQNFKNSNFLLGSTLDKIDRANVQGYSPAMRIEYYDLNSLVHGFKAGNLLHVVCELPDQRHLVSLNLANQIAIELNHSTLVFTQEDYSDYFMRGLLSINSGMSLSALLKADHKEIDWPKMTLAVTKTKDKSLFLNDTKWSCADDIRSIYLELNAISGKKTKWLIIDEISSIKVASGRRRCSTEEQSFLLRLKEIATTYDCCVIYLSTMKTKENMRFLESTNADCMLLISALKNKSDIHPYSFKASILDHNLNYLGSSILNQDKHSELLHVAG